MDEIDKIDALESDVSALERTLGDTAQVTAAFEGAVARHARDDGRDNARSGQSGAWILAGLAHCI